MVFMLPRINFLKNPWNLKILDTFLAKKNLIITIRMVFVLTRIKTALNLYVGSQLIGKL